VKNNLQDRTNTRMSYETYAYLRSLIEDQQKKLEKEFQTACKYIPSEMVRGNKLSGRDKAHKIFLESSNQLDEINKELKDAAASTYKDHPNPEMKRFWGLS